MLFLPMLSFLALADVPPPAGMKRVPYYVQVVGPPTAGPRRLVVYPWSLSGGAPEALAAVVPADGRVQIGRRVAGRPSFWLVPAEQAGALEDMDEAALETWFASGAGIQCTGDPIQPQSEVTLLGGSEVVDRFAMDLVSDTECGMSQLGSREGIGTGGGPGGCTCGTVSSVVLPTWIGLFGLLGLRRRRG